MPRLLITGASGTLGRNVVRMAQRQGWDVCGTYHTAPPPLPGQWHRLDVGDRDAVLALVRLTQPAAIIHTAYMYRGAALWATTADGAAFVALAAAEAGARLVHISSDAVFDGTSNPYTETARPSPITHYGAAKAAAETAVSAIAPRAAIVRTSLIISREPLDPQTRLVLDLATGRRAGHLFTDQYRCPIGADDLAEAALELAANDFAGVINVAGADALTRYDLGSLIAGAYQLDPAKLAGASVATLSTPAVVDVRLDSSLARSLLKTPLRGIRQWLGAEA
ncbi:MAG TPA: sugar nucleotide-binding protein [Ktedonobacterales bacterium]|nr:sugar nucleotide-binding protein [Ktedonobacterales bacterium]